MAALLWFRARTAPKPQHEGMPSSAIATGAIDIIASVEAMPGHIIAVQQARVAPQPPVKHFRPCS